MTARQKRVGVHEAKTHLSRLLHDVERGTDVIVMRGGRPIARLVKVGSERTAETSYGMFRGQFTMSDDFESGSDELGDLFGIPR